MKIFTDLAASAATLDMLRQGIAPHELLLPSAASASVLADQPTDPLMLDADVVLGQPRVDAVLSSVNLQWLQVSTAGYTRYDTPEFREAVKEKGILVTNSSRVYDDACAEHALAFMLANARRLPQGLSSRCANGTDEWFDLRRKSRLLAGGRVVIAGYGSIAERLIGLLAPFGMDIVAIRRSRRGDEMVDVVSPGESAAALAAADHVIDILPENPESKHWFDAGRFAVMKPGAVFYNIGRGTTVDQEALAAALKSGRLGAAWLDVTDPEPLPDDHPLRSCPNCHITPHTAGGQEGEADVLVRHFLRNFQRWLAGEELENRIM